MNYFFHATFFINYPKRQKWKTPQSDKRILIHLLGIINAKSFNL